MKATDVLMIVAVVAVLLAGVNLMITINKIDDFKVLSGFATDEGTANLTIQSNAQVNFSVRNVDWQTGYVNVSKGSATLTTTGIMNGTGWSTINTGLILENIGNEDVYVNLTSSKTAATFIGTGAIWMYNLTENDTSQSCTGGLSVSDWTAFSTGDIDQICANFTANNTADEILIDLKVVIPELGVATGDKGVTVTATAYTAV